MQLASSDDSVLPQLVQVWYSIIKGNHREAYLTIGDIDTFLEVDNTSVASNSKSSAMLCELRGVCRLNIGHYEQAIPWLLKAAEMTDYKKTSVLVNLICAYQNTNSPNEAEDITFKLKAIAPPSHPYISKLDLLEEVAMHYNKESK